MNKLILFIVALILTSCGSTSHIKNSKNNSLSNFSTDDTVIVNDFVDGVSKTGNDPNVIAEGKKFADMIASSIQSTTFI